MPSLLFRSLARRLVTWLRAVWGGIGCFAAVDELPRDALH